MYPCNSIFDKTVTYQVAKCGYKAATKWPVAIAPDKLASMPQPLDTVNTLRPRWDPTPKNPQAPCAHKVQRCEMRARCDFAVAGFYEIEAVISIALLSFYATAKASAFAPDGYFFGADW